MSAGDGQRPVKLIVGEALAELRGREQRLLGALTEARAAIRALEDLAHREREARREPVSSAETDGAPVKLVRSSGPVSDKERDDVVRQTIADNQPCPMGILTRKSGLTTGMLKPSLQRLRDSGEIQLIGLRSTSRYWLTADLDRYVAEHDGALPLPPTPLRTEAVA